MVMTKKANILVGIIIKPFNPRAKESGTIIFNIKYGKSHAKIKDDDDKEQNLSLIRVLGLII